MNPFYSEIYTITKDLKHLHQLGYRTEETQIIPPQFKEKAKIIEPIISDKQGAKSLKIIEINDLTSLKLAIEGCTHCPHHTSRIKAVPGSGNESPKVLVLGDFPGPEEDRTGRPFMGESGAFLDKWLESIGLSRYETVFLTTLLKCRPKDSSLNVGVDSCLTHFHHQIKFLKPKVILVLGESVIQKLLDTQETLENLRNTELKFENIALIPTFSPREVLMKQDLKRPVWEDLKKLKALVG